MGHTVVVLNLQQSSLYYCWCSVPLSSSPSKSFCHISFSSLSIIHLEASTHLCPAGPTVTVSHAEDERPIDIILNLPNFFWSHLFFPPSASSFPSKSPLATYPSAVSFSTGSSLSFSFSLGTGSLSLVARPCFCTRGVCLSQISDFPPRSTNIPGIQDLESLLT
ncbi:hypothetical protein HCH54_006674 [Aspergillus fumigatus]